MRISEREITDFDEIVSVLRRADTVRLGIHAEPYPYVVPLSFGLEAAAGKIRVYFHGAKVGMKAELLAKDNRVCVEADIFHGYTAKGTSTEYESFIGFGEVTLLKGAEACAGMDLLLEHCGYAGVEYGRAGLDGNVNVYRIDVASFTGKRNIVQAGQV